MENRRWRRKQVEAGCWIADGEEAVCLDISDISTSGAFIATQHPLPPGRTVRLELFTPRSARPVCVEAEVVWSRVGDADEAEAGMGIKFMGLDEAQRQALLELAALEKARQEEQEEQG